jgi:ABC-type multidrug transport system fused ATPase/permease subunit
MGWHGSGGHFAGLDDDEEDYRRSVSDWVLTKRMFAYTLRYRRRVLLTFAAVLFNSAINLLPPILFTWAIDRYITKLDMAGLAILSAAFILVNLVTFGTQFAQNYLIEWLAAKMEYDMRLDAFRHLQKLSLGYFADKEVGAVVSRLTNDIEKITELVSLGLVVVIADLLTLVGIMTIMLWMDVRLSLITFTVIPMTIIFMVLWGNRVRRVYRETRKTIASVSAQMEESVSGIKEIQSYSKEGNTRTEFQRVNVSNMEANVEASRVMSAFWPAVTIFTAVGQGLVLWFGGTEVIEGALTVGILFGFISYLSRFFMPIQDLSMFWNSVQSALAAAERIFKVIDTPIGIDDALDAITLDDIEGRITFEKMSFGYNEDQPILNDINLVVEPNTTVALVGPTGVGKTTLVNLLYRFYDPSTGRITIDGVDLRRVNVHSLRVKMGIVLQDPFLFSGTIMENIKYGKPLVSNTEVIAVSKAIGAHDFIEKLPEGYNTEVKERGGRLSIGQRQLVSLARALIVNPRILIMDEATSSIDAYTELLIQSAMNHVFEGRTSFIIAHRLSTVRNADIIVVLDQGRIVEQGKHEELLMKDGLYRRLYEMQFKTDQPEENTNMSEAKGDGPGT